MSRRYPDSLGEEEEGRVVVVVEAKGTWLSVAIKQTCLSLVNSTDCWFPPCTNVIGAVPLVLPNVTVTLRKREATEQCGFCWYKSAEEQTPCRYLVLVDLLTNAGSSKKMLEN